LQKLQSIFDEEGHPYTGNPSDIVNSHLRKDPSTHKYYVIDNIFLREIGDKEISIMFHFDLSKAKPLTKADKELYIIGTKMNMTSILSEINVK